VVVDEGQHPLPLDSSGLRVCRRNADTAKPLLNLTSQRIQYRNQKSDLSRFATGSTPPLVPAMLAGAHHPSCPRNGTSPVFNPSRGRSVGQCGKNCSPGHSCEPAHFARCIRSTALILTSQIGVPAPQTSSK
jgi:hypothetical protein